MGYTPEDKEFWTTRGIDPEVRDARPYTRYYAGDPTTVREAYQRLPNRGQRSTTTRKATYIHKGGDKAGTPVNGLLIHRKPALPEFEEIFPELRPDDAISTAAPRRHWHGWGEPPADDRYYEKMNPESDPGLAHRWKWHTAPFGVTTEENKAARERGEEPGNTEDVHPTKNPGKYHFPPTGKRELPYKHDHDEVYSGVNIKVHSKYIDIPTIEQRRAWHVNKRSTHGGADVKGEHSHVRMVPDRGENLARRLDAHPWAAGLLTGAEEVFFGLEGCLKADAILTAILKSKRKASVVSVPSVTLWETREMPEFTGRVLRHKRVILVPDADWIDNPRVIEQARLGRTYLRRLGAKDTYIAAPPLKAGKVEHKGIDDYLGAGGTLDGLMVQHRVVDEWALRDFLRPFYLAKDRHARALDMLHALAEHVGVDGQFYGTLARFARVLGTNDMRVGRAVKDLEALGAITISGSLEIRKDYFLRGYGWGPDNPVIILREDLRGHDEEYELTELQPTKGRLRDRAVERRKLSPFLVNF